MADGASVRKSAGNDFIYDYNCTVCLRKKNTYSEAVCYCPQCKTYYCKQCFGNGGCDHDLIGRGNFAKCEQRGEVVGNSVSDQTLLKARTVRTLYHCKTEDNTELSFGPNQIIKNVRPSKEPGWLEGTLDGRTGLIPDNYIEYID